MRTFSLFVSALAFANLAQATPLVDTELAQLNAELDTDVDAQKRFEKSTAEQLLKDLAAPDSVLNMAKDGVEYTESMETINVWHSTSSSEYGGEMRESQQLQRKSTFDDDKVEAWAKKWKKNKELYQTQDTRNLDFKDFTAWAAKIDGAIPGFKKAIQEPMINNFDPSVKTMKSEMSKMINCLTSDECSRRFVSHTMKVWEANNK